MHFAAKTLWAISVSVVSLSAQTITTSAVSPLPISPVKPLYLYSHFRDNDALHLRLSYSSTATDWREVNPQGSFSGTAMRDPSIMYVAGNQTFYFIVTPPPGQTQIQFFSSTDLVNFSAIRMIDMAAYVPGAVTAWAPEWWHDPQDGKFYFFVSISTDLQGRTSSTAIMAPYLLQFDPVKGEVVGSPRPIPLQGTTQGRTFDFFPYYDGQLYYLFYVDQQPGGTAGNVTQPIAYASSPRLEGPYAQQTIPGTDYFGLGTFQSEAPTVIPLGETGCVRLVFDTWAAAPSSSSLASGDSSNNNIAAGRQYTPVYRDSCTNFGRLFSQTSLFEGQTHCTSWPRNTARSLP